MQEKWGGTWLSDETERIWLQWSYLTYKNIETIWGQMLVWKDFKMEAPWQNPNDKPYAGIEEKRSGFAFLLKALISPKSPPTEG